MSLDDEMFRVIAEQASDGIFVTDEDLRIAWMNPRACQLLRSPPNLLIGRRVADLFWDPPGEEPLRRKELLAGQSTMTVRHFRAGDGSRVVLEVSARSIGGGRVVGIARDATARLEAEARLARSEASFRALIEQSPDGVVVHRDGVIVYANRRMATLLGWPSPESAVGTRVIDLVHPDDRDAVRVRIRRVNEEDTVPFDEERLLRRDGTSVTCSIGAVAVIFEGQPGIAAIARDVTQQRKIQTQLAVTDRLASLGALAAGVAHEINNPLTFVLLRLGALDSLVASTHATEAEQAMLAEHIEVARDGAERVRRIVSDLRVFSRTYDDVQVPIDPRIPLEHAIGMASHELKHRASIVRSIEPVPMVLGSEGRLAQVFVNLLLNAAQALPDDEPDRHAVHVRTRTDDGAAVIEIEDDGPGIPSENVARLFDPFFTTKPIGVGTGLGLSICHGIVTGLGGTIAVDSELGRGTRVTVRLPGTEVRGAAIPSPPPAAVAWLGRILVVDDEPAIGRSLVEALEGVADVVAVDGGGAARALLERDSRFDAILCDVCMPGMSGLELHAWVAEKLPALAARMVFMTGGRLGAAERDLFEDSRLIEKPFDLATIRSRLAKIVQGR
ncbi:MAG: PAS domain S-box protein [Polyangiales bacterium]